MAIQVFGTNKCKATRAAQRFFAERRVKVHNIDLREKGMAKGELASVARAVGGLRALYDATSTRAKERGLAYLDVSEDRLEALLLEDPLLLRTPVVRSGARAAVGLAEQAWQAFVDAEKK